ncbi:MAG: hypothetical protein COZ57_07755 [Armatimonadetes bacterium CG_4_8_14_3_um_filter_66_20]|nr:MAG: hypothetical protein COZ57_07755 [Armatimonadetes bacterium CG_4_8_14_3_um_filter_66_20]
MNSAVAVPSAKGRWTWAIWAGVAVLAVALTGLTARMPIRELALYSCGAVGLAAVFVLGLRNPAAAVALFFAYMSVDGMLRLLTGYHPLVHLALDLFTIAVTAGVAVRESLRGELRVRLGTVETLLVGFSLLCVVGVFNPSTRPLLGLMGVKVHLTAVPFYFLGYYLRRSQEADRRWFALFCCLGTFVCSFALIQYLTGPDLWTSMGPAFAEKISREQWWDDTGELHFRPLSSTLSGSWPGVYAGVSLPLLMGLFGLASLRAQMPLLWGVAVVQTASLLISAFRGGWVALAGGLALFCLLRRSARSTAVLVGVALGCLVGVALSQGGLKDRARSLGNPVSTYMNERGHTAWSIFVRSVTRSPLGLGTGTSSVAAEYFESAGDSGASVWLAESYYVSLAVELGIVGLTVMLLCLGTIFWRGIRALGATRTGEERGMVASMLSMLSTLATIGLVGPVLHGSFPAAYFWFVSGMLMRRASNLTRVEASASHG